MKWLYRLGLPIFAQLTLLYLLLVGIAKTAEPTGWWPFMLVDYLPVICVVAPVFGGAVGYALYRWPRPALILAVSGALCLMFWTDTIPYRRQPSSLHRAVRLITWNTQWNGGLAEIEGLLKREHPDVVCLQEIMSEGRTDPLWERLRKQGWFVVQKRQYAVISRYPARITQIEPYMMGVEITIDHQRLRVASAHLWLPYNLFCRNPIEYLQSIGPMNTSRNHQVDSILNTENPPDVVCGDMNTPSNTALMGRFTQRYQDSHLAGGVGGGLSFPVRWPMIRIDHIFLAPHLRILTNRTLKLRGSDHRAVMVEFVLPKGSARKR